jgi:DNA excision repair protein ERCC-2
MVVKITQKIAVRQVVEFIMRKGSLDTRRASEHTAQAGARIHRQLQKAAGPNYQKEVTLKMTVCLNERPHSVEGRADGIFVNEAGETVIEEIKTSEPAFEDVPPEKIDLYWYQAMCYGHIYCQQENLGSIIFCVGGKSKAIFY